MVRPGDTVRYLSEVGGGTVMRVEGKIAYVDDEGFERPVAVSELVVVNPAGHSTGGARLMFDQKAFDTGRDSQRGAPDMAVSAAPAPIAEEEFPIEETDYGDALSVVLAFEPRNVKTLDSTDFNVALVNDSNYFLNYQILIHSGEGGEWKGFARGEAAPNEIVDLRRVSHSELPELERIVFQAIAYKKDKSFEIKTPLNASRKLDLTKFFKFHCFRPGLYFDTPVLEVGLLAEKTPGEARPEKSGKRR